jgi:hypothetical protein
MFRSRFSHWLLGVGLLVALEGATALVAELSVPTSAQAQFRDDRYPFARRQYQRSGGFFQELFGGFERRGPAREGPYRAEPPREHVDYSRAPSPHKPDPNAPPPTTTIVVMGDGMADWLAYGLEDAFSDSPEVAIVRQNKQRSGLIRYEARSDLDWWHVARDDLAQEKANYVVVMLGLSDRQNISEKDVAKEAEKAQQEKNAQNPAAQKQPADKSHQPLIAAPEQKYPRGVIPFRSDRWAQIYSRRIDLMIAALKSKGVPVFWVGLPSIRGTRSTADAVYLNDLFRARAERAGVDYIDIWDGFVDEAGKYSSYGPDYEGQIRRLRSGDGVFFTKYGARKLAHYVEHEIRRYMSNRVVALPTGPVKPVPGGKSTVRPVAGPVLPLSTIISNGDVLEGGPGMRTARGDAVVTDVLVKGEAIAAPPGRSDDFSWPAGSDGKKPPAAAKTAPAASAAPHSAPAAVANAAPTATAPVRAVAPAVTAKPLAPPVQAKQPVRTNKQPVEANIAPTAPAAAKVTPREPKPGVAKVIPVEPAQAKVGPEEVKPVETKKPAEAKRGKRDEVTVQSRPLLPPAPVGRQSTHRAPQHRTPSLFGPDGLFGWLH